jgi:DNA-directed RNA polymerase subunit RPC12/RpoP
VTRVCVQCGEALGERCVQCGAEAVPLHAAPQSTVPAGLDFECPACGHRFTKGEGGVTGGMCEPCFDTALRKAHEQQKTGRQ